MSAILQDSNPLFGSELSSDGFEHPPRASDENKHASEQSNLERKQPWMECFGLGNNIEIQQSTLSLSVYIYNIINH